MKIIILLFLQQLVVICTVGSLTAQVHDSSRLLLMMMSPCCIVGYLVGCFSLRKSFIDPSRIIKLLAILCTFVVLMAVLLVIIFLTAKNSKNENFANTMGPDPIVSSA